VDGEQLVFAERCAKAAYDAFLSDAYLGRPFGELELRVSPTEGRRGTFEQVVRRARSDVGAERHQPDGSDSDNQFAVAKNRSSQACCGIPSDVDLIALLDWT